jgi:hypothetical protein
MDNDNSKTAEQLAAEAAAAADKTTGKKVKARVLVAGAHGKVNDVINVDAATVTAHDKAVKDGLASAEFDTSKAAVAYAESLAGSN